MNGQVDMLSSSAFGRRDLRIPATMEMLHSAREWAAAAAADFGLSDEERFQVKLAMSEAVTNAILHGSGSEADTVKIDARESDGALVFEVRDAGADPGTSGTGPPGRIGEGGRGLELVSLVMDEVRLTRGEAGGVLRFAKRRTA